MGLTSIAHIHSTQQPYILFTFFFLTLSATLKPKHRSIRTDSLIPDSPTPAQLYSTPPLSSQTQVRLRRDGKWESVTTYA